MPSVPQYVEAPREWHGRDVPSVFLAGGITDCPDWQREARKIIWGGVTVLNPRREDFPIDDPSAAAEQIEWEYNHLRAADVILFWFTGGASPQPIVLYELGRHAALGGPIAVGADPEYSRRQDVVIQLALARPTVQVFSTLDETCREALKLARPDVFA